MKQPDTGGLQLYAAPACAEQPPFLPGFLLALTLYTGAAETLRGMLGAEPLPVIFAAGLLILSAETAAMRSRKASFAFHTALALGLLLVLVCASARLADGFKLLCNRLFAMSEASQAYAYDYFQVHAAESEQSVCFVLAMLLCVTAIALLSAGIAQKKHIVSALFVAALAAGAEMYLGIAPAASWNVLLFVSLGAALLWRRCDTAVGRRLFFWMLAAALTVSMALVPLLPRENTAVTALSESLRDQFGEREIRFVPAEQAESTPADSQHPDPTPKSTGVTAGSRKINVQLLITIPAILAALLIVALVEQIKKRRQAAKARIRSFHDSNCALGIKSMFAYLLEWLLVCGLHPENHVYAAYQAQLDALLPPDCAARWENTVRLWQEAAYSTHDMLPEQRDQMRSNLETITRALWNGAGNWRRFKIHFYYFL